MSDRAILAKSSPVTPLQLPTWAVGVPVVLLLGFLTLLGRAGVGIQVFGIPLGAYLTPVPTALVGLLLVSRRGRALLGSLDRPRRRVVIAVGIAVGAGLLRAAAQGTPTLLRFQDMAYLLHLPWIIVGMAAMKSLRSDEERLRVLRWIAWTLALALALHLAREVIAPIGWLFDQLIGSLEVLSDKPGELMKAGDHVLYGIALAALAMHLTGTNGRRIKGMALIISAGLLLGTQLANLFLGGSRGALLGVLLGGAVLMFHQSSQAARGILLGTTALAFLLSSAVILSTATDLAGSPPIRERYEMLADRRAVTATLEQLRIEDGEFARPSTVSWRIAIWTDVIDEWNSSWTNRLFGIGFGTDIEAMTVPGRQGFDGLNRSVHSIAFTVLARQGLIGIAAASAILLALTFPRPLTRAITTPILVTAVSVGLFDAFLEGVQAPVVLWILVGMVSNEPSSSQRSSISSKSAT